MTRSLNTYQEKKLIVVIGEESSGKTCLTKHLVKEDASKCLAEHRTTVDESHYTIQKMPGRYFKLHFIQTYVTNNL